MILNQTRCLQDGVYGDIDMAEQVFEYFVNEKYVGDCLFLVEIIDKSNINNHKFIPDCMWHMNEDKS